jgi:hypothetical protein
MTDNLHPARIEELALAYANQWLEEIDYLTVHEMLEDDLIPYTDDDAEKIYDRITTSHMRFSD